jgi:hypothetical protein
VYVPLGSPKTHLLDVDGTVVASQPRQDCQVASLSLGAFARVGLVALLRAYVVTTTGGLGDSAGVSAGAGVDVAPGAGVTGTGEAVGIGEAVD